MGVDPPARYVRAMPNGATATDCDRVQDTHRRGVVTMRTHWAFVVPCDGVCRTQIALKKATCAATLGRLASRSRRAAERLSVGACMTGNNPRSTRVASYCAAVCPPGVAA